jgi:hypothetical protein
MFYCFLGLHATNPKQKGYKRYQKRDEITERKTEWHLFLVVVVLLSNNTHPLFFKKKRSTQTPPSPHVEAIVIPHNNTSNMAAKRGEQQVTHVKPNQNHERVDHE